MCTGDVEMNVWIRLRLAGRIASAQRSMSFGAARERPRITAFLERCAISRTAAKSPSEAIGKPASMKLAPMSSSSSATSSFSSCVMVAPGHCSPSRKVVSKMTTRSFADWVSLLIAKFLLSHAPLKGRSMGFLRRVPRAPRHHTPRRPSGADKERERAQNEGGLGAGGARRPYDRAGDLARRHGLSKTLVTSTVRVVEPGKARVNRLENRF